MGLIGDSMTLGLERLLEDRMTADVIPLGEGGTAIARIVAVGRQFVASNPGSDVVIWGGHKDVLQGRPQAVVSAIAALDGDVVAAGGRLIVLSLTNRPDAGRGTALYKSLADVNNALAAQQGAEYLNLRWWLIHQALGWLGVEPTPIDQANIADDVVPDSLRADVGNVGHLNTQNGKPAAAYKISFYLNRLPAPA